MCRLRIFQVDFWNDGTLRKTAILRTTVQMAGKNGYGGAKLITRPMDQKTVRTHSLELSIN